MKLTGEGDTVLATWPVPVDQYHYTYRFASAHFGDNSATVGVLAENSTNRSVTLITAAADEHSLLAWSGPLSPSAQIDGLMRGIRLDSAGTPLLGGTNRPIDDEFLDVSIDSCNDGGRLSAGASDSTGPVLAAGRLCLNDADARRGETFGIGYRQYLLYRDDNLPLSHSRPRIVAAPESSSFAASTLFLWSDRFLAVGTEDGYVAFESGWR